MSIEDFIVAERWVINFIMFLVSLMLSEVKYCPAENTSSN
jgi:hypothetical protein